jgi:hypothetical protein
VPSSASPVSRKAVLVNSKYGRRCEKPCLIMPFTRIKSFLKKLMVTSNSITDKTASV